MYAYNILNSTKMNTRMNYFDLWVNNFIVQFLTLCNTNILCVNFLIIDLYTYNIFDVVTCIKINFEYYFQRTSLNTCP